MKRNSHLLRPLTAAFFLTLSTAAFSSVLIHGDATSEDKTFDFAEPWVVEHDGGAVYGLLARGGHTATVTGNVIDLTVRNTKTDGTADWQDTDSKAYGFIAHYSDSTEKSRVLLGDESTDTILVDVSARGWAHGIGTLNSNTYKSNGVPEMVVTAKTLKVNVYSEETYAYGIIAQNGTTDATEYAHTVINAENTYVNVRTDAEDLGEPGAAGLVAMSQGVLDINGNLFVDAYSPEGASALLTRGDSTTNININGTHTVQMNGDIRFDYSSLNSYTKVDSTVNLKLTNANSFLNGNILVTGNPPTQEKAEVLRMNLTLANGGTWSATKDSFVNRLTMDGGVIRITDASAKIDVLNEFDGNGTIVLAAEQTEQGLSAAGFAIAEGVTPAENSSLAITYSGVTADDVQDVETAFDQLNSKVNVDGIKQSRTIAEGNIRGAVTQELNAQGTVTNTYKTANTKLASFSSVNAMSLVQWRNEINHLTKRLGDIRASEGTIGAWARVYGGESQWGGNNEVEMDHTTLQVGGDWRLNNHWTAGGAFSYTDSDAEFGNGSADGESYSLAAYATYTADGGSFLDLIARYGYLKNDIVAGNMGIDMDSNAFSLSAEMGHTFRFIEDRAYVEPQVEFSYGFISGDDGTATNGVRLDQDDFQSFVTRVGVRVGYDFPEKKGSFYGTFSYSYDWMGDADGMASQDGLRQALSEELGGGWVTYGIGAQFMMGNNAYVYGELERTSGGDIDNPYLFSAGVRLTF